MSLKFVTNGLRSLRISSGPSPLGQPRMFGLESGSGTNASAPSLIPPKPKRPLSPYFRFMAAVRPEMKNENPKVSSLELMRMMALRWDKLDPSAKEKYIMAYRKERTSFQPLIDKYKNSLTPEQKNAEKQHRLEREIKREEKDKRKRSKELGKPKRPPNAFFRYLMEKSVNKAMAVGERQAFTKELAEEWRTMPDKDKASYVLAYQADLDNYGRLLSKWEDKMMKKGYEDLVRVSSLMQAKRDGKKSAPAKSG